MRILIPGGTGLIGSALADRARSRGDEVWVLTRREPRSEHEIQWDTSRGVTPVRAIEGMDAVVHLVGAPLAARAWTPGRRALLRDSRIKATETLAASLSKLDDPPDHWIGVGSLGRFGSRGDAWIDDEDSPAEEGFLAELSVAWETAQHEAAASIGARSAVLRMGVVLASRGGIVPPLITPFRYGFGGWVGDGDQYTPWISLRDATRALLHLLDDPSCEGGFNGNVPDPVRHRAWCEAFGEAVGRPVRGPAATWALRGALGELVDALILSSVRARPRRLVDHGFTFEDPEIGPLLKRLVSERRG